MPFALQRRRAVYGLSTTPRYYPWKLKWKEVVKDDKGKPCPSFSPSRWLAEGLPFEDAVAETLEEAKRFLAKIPACGAPQKRGPSARKSGKVTGRVRLGEALRRASKSKMRVSQRSSGVRRTNCHPTKRRMLTDSCHAACTEARRSLRGLARPGKCAPPRNRRRRLPPLGRCAAR